jgi:methyl-accepting chemotaxis protein
MADNRGLSIRPDAVNEVTRQIDELANRMQHVLDTEKSNLNVVASGRDEVSQRVAQTADAVHDSFRKASDQGVNEFHEVAATLRSDSGRIADADLA